MVNLVEEKLGNQIWGLGRLVLHFQQQNLILLLADGPYIYVLIDFALVNDGFHLPIVAKLGLHEVRDAKNSNPILDLHDSSFCPGCPQQPCMLFFDISGRT